MAIDSVLTRIDQIAAMRQMLADPAAYASRTAAASAAGRTAASGLAASGLAASGLAASGATTGASPTGAPAGSGSSFASLLAGAQAGSAPSATGGVGTGNPSQAVQAMTQMANSLVGKPYVWGGGHGGWGAQPGYDCSGFVSAVLHAGGYLSSPADTTSLPSQAGIETGPGQYVTIYDRAQPGDQGHVIIEVAGQFYESGGETGSWGGGGGVARINRPPDSYLATFPNVLHPSGL